MPHRRFNRIVLGVVISLYAQLALAADISSAPYGVTRNGQPVEVFTLRNDHGLTVRVLTYGGTLESIRTPRGLVMDDLIVSLPDLAAYEDAPNFSCLLGRYANRISGGGFTLDHKRFNLTANAAGIISHGGPGGFSARVWKGAPFRRGAAVGVTLSQVSPDGQNGFPGQLETQVTFTLTQDGALRIDYRATTSRPTVINLSHHVYFNLAGGGSVADQRLTVLANRYTPIDSRKIPTGQLAPVAQTAFDLRRPTTLAAPLASSDPQILIAKGLDHNFVLTKPRPNALSLAARLDDPLTGRSLETSTTEPGLQVYTANGFNGSKLDAAGRPIQAHGAVALETQHFPDSPNRADFPSTTLRPGQVFRSTTIYKFGGLNR